VTFPEEYLKTIVNAYKNAMETVETVQVDGMKQIQKHNLV